MTLNQHNGSYSQSGNADLPSLGLTMFSILTSSRWHLIAFSGLQTLTPNTRHSCARHRDDGKDKTFGAFLFALVIFSATLAILLATPAKAASLKVIDKYFYGEVITNGEANHRQKTNRIPNVAGKMCFGWVIEVEPSDELAKITEIFTLPAAPKIWGGVEDDPYSQTTTTNDRKVATTNRFMPLKSGKLENTWCLTQGDQSGDHHIVVLYGTQVLAEFEFEVYE